jgi:hypothetical protein
MKMEKGKALRRGEGKRGKKKMGVGGGEMAKEKRHGKKEKEKRKG